MNELQLLSTFKNPDEFKRLITSNYQLLETAKLFPQHAEIFGKSSVNEAADAAKLYALSKISYSEIIKNARAIAQAIRTNTGPSFFKGGDKKDLPVELNTKIAALTGNPTVHDEKQSESIAYQYLSKPYFTEHAKPARSDLELSLPIVTSCI